MKAFASAAEGKKASSIEVGDYEHEDVEREICNTQRYSRSHGRSGAKELADAREIRSPRCRVVVATVKRGV